MDLSVVIVAHNSRHDLPRAIRSLLASRIEYSFEIIVVDNGSTDATAALVEQEFLSRPELAGQLKLIKNTNQGFAKGNNRGIQQASGDYVLVLNPDTEVQPATLQTMLDFMKSRPDVGIATAKLIKADGTLDLACRRSFPDPASAIFRFTGLSLLFPKSKRLAKYNLTYTNENEAMEIDACNGAFMLLSPQCLTAVKGFDEDFFMYDEDIDLCLRAKQAGFKVWYYPQAVTTHFKGQPYRQSPRQLRIFHESKWTYYKKHLAQRYPAVFNGLMYLAIWAHFMLQLVVNALRPKKPGQA